MSADSFRQVLALLHDTEHEMWRVLERAIELADTERARLTLAKTTDPGRLVSWVAARSAAWQWLRASQARVACPSAPST